jgi:hypothetical protein
MLTPRLILMFAVKYGVAFHDFGAAPCAGDMYGRLVACLVVFIALLFS